MLVFTIIFKAKMVSNLCTCVLLASVFSVSSFVNLQRNQLLKVCGSFFFKQTFYGLVPNQIEQENLVAMDLYICCYPKHKLLLHIIIFSFHFRQAKKNSWCRTCQRSVEFFSPWTSSSVFLAFAAFLQVKFANVGIKTK